jgi:hypothetical protein
LAPKSLLSDDLVRALTAVGNVDVLVGIPTLNNSATIQHIVHAVSEAFLRYFPRERTLLLNCDGGSHDDTPALVRGARGQAGAMTVSHRLRTEHRITTPYHGLPGKGGALRQIMTVADLTQARAVAVLDADVTSLTPEWIAALIRPVRTQHYDYVTPIYARHPAEAPLITQLVRPVVRATYGWQVQEPLAAEFGCSQRFVAHCLEQDVWETELATYGIDLWMTCAALAGGFACCQAPLGVRHAATTGDRPGFPGVFQQVVGATFACLEQHAKYWLPRTGSNPLPIVGIDVARPDQPPSLDGTRLAHDFCADLRNLQDVLEPLLSPPTLAGLNAAAGNCEPLRVPDQLWAATVFEFLAAHHRGVIRREHIAQALAPLYLGRTGAFLSQYGAADAVDGEAALEALGVEFERSKPIAVDRWEESVPR